MGEAPNAVSGTRAPLLPRRLSPLRSHCGKAGSSCTYASHLCNKAAAEGGVEAPLLSRYVEPPPNSGAPPRHGVPRGGSPWLRRVLPRCSFPERGFFLIRNRSLVSISKCAQGTHYVWSTKGVDVVYRSLELTLLTLDVPTVSVRFYACLQPQLWCLAVRQPGEESHVSRV